MNDSAVRADDSARRGGEALASPDTSPVTRVRRSPRPTPSPPRGPRRPVLSGTVAAALVLLLAGCGQDPGTAAGPIPTTPETVQADVPTLPPATDPTTDPTAMVTPDATQAADAGTDPGRATTAADQDVFGIDVADIADALSQDPELAGERGEDLLEELERVLDRPRDRKRIERALERTQRWAGEDELDDGLAVATIAALEDLLADADTDDDAHDDEDD